MAAPGSNTRAAAAADCPACGAAGSGRVLFAPPPRPVLNNVLYATKAAARAALSGPVELVACGACGLVFNRAFDETLIEYSETYDSARAHSAAFAAYLDSLATEIAPGIGRDRRVVEIGCGDGSFLARLHSATGAACIGFDVNATARADGTLEFVAGRFDPARAGGGCDVLILRHVLEHIPAPRVFLESLLAQGFPVPGGEVIVEVPDLGWILEHETFFDITYEHCNYFDPASLAHLAESAGLNVQDCRPAFAAQYLLLRAEAAAPEAVNPRKLRVFMAPELHENRAAAFSRLGQRPSGLSDWIAANGPVAVWGCSGKGVMLLSELEGPAREAVAYVIDANPTKQGRFAPVSGFEVAAPAALRRHRGPLSVLIMNGAYEREIRQTLAGMTVDANVKVL